MFKAMLVLVTMVYMGHANATQPSLVCPAGSSGAHVLAGFMSTQIPTLAAAIVYNHAVSRHDSCGECERARAKLIDSNLEVYSASATLGDLPNRGQQSTSADIAAVREANGGKLWVEKAGGSNVVNAVRTVGLVCIPTTPL